MVTVSFNTARGKDYIDDVKARLKRDGISYGEMSRAMDPPMSVPQFSRWMNKRVKPNLDNITRIETAYAKIMQARSKK